MRHLLLLIIALAFVVFSPIARALDPEFEKIVSYSRLSRLSPEKRIEYIRQVRLLVDEFEQIQKDYANDPKNFAEYKERSLFLEMMVREAEAMGADAGGGAAYADKNRRETAEKARKERALSVARFLSVYSGCPTNLTTRLPRVTQHILKDGAALQCSTSGACQPGFNRLGGWGSQSVCYKPGVKKAELARRRAARAQPIKVAASPPVKKAARSVASQATNKPRPLVRASDAEGKAPAAARTQPPAPEDFDGDADAIQDIDGEGTTADDDSATHVTDERRDKFTIDKNAQFAIDGKFASATTNDVTCKDEPSTRPPETCTDNSVKKARQAYYRSTAPHCLYAGNLQHYRNNEKKPGKCQLPREFCLSNVSCRKPDESYREKIETVLRCDDGKIICNPMLFNLDENDRALCISPTKDATAACAARASQVEEAWSKSHADGLKSYVPFIFRLKVNKPGGTSAEENLNGIADAWDAYAKELNAICHDDVSKNLYCRECQIMRARAAQLNLLTFRAEKKPDADGNCYEFSAMPRTTKPGTMIPESSVGAGRAR